MKKHSIAKRKKAHRKASREESPEIFAGVAAASTEAALLFSVTVEYGERNIRSLTFAAKRGLKQLKAHLAKSVGPNWVRAEVILPKGTRTVLRNPKGIKVIA